MTAKPTYAELEQRVEALEKKIIDLAKLEEQLRLLSLAVEQGSEGIAIADLEGNLKYINNAFAEMHGYSAEELMGASLSIFHTPEQMPSVEAANLKLKQTGSFKGEIWHARRDGDVFPALMHNSLVKDETNTPIGMMVTLRDISDMKKTEEVQVQRSERYQKLAEATFDGIVVMHKGIILEVNSAFAAMFGYEPSELIGRDAIDVVASESRDVVFQNIMSDYEKPYEALALRKDGSTFYVEVRGTKVNLGRRMVRMTAIHDITERKEAEEKLKKSEARFRALFESTTSCMLVVEDRVIRDVNQATSNAFGYNADEMIGKDTSLIHISRESYEESGKMAHESIQNKGYWHAELPFKKKNGETIWMSVYLSALPERGIVAVMHDITARKRAETALKESEERFRRFSDAAFEAIIIHEGGILISANDQYYEMFGYEPEELMGKQALPLTIAPEAMESARGKIATGGLGPYESIGLKKDGTRFPIEIRVREWEYEGRKVRVAAIMDITERKQAEEMLQRYNQRLMILRDIDQDIAIARSPTAIADTVLKHIRQLIPCWKASIALYEHDTNEIVSFASEANGETAVQPGMRLPAPAGWVPRILTEHCYIVEDVNELSGPISPNVRLAIAEGTRSYLTASLVVEGNPIGGLILSSKTPAAFTAEHLEIASEVANQLAIAMHQARLKEQIERHTAELEERVAQRTAELKAINAELQAFTYTVSHDLKAPLRGIDGYSRLLLQDHVDKLDEEGQTFLHIIRSATQQMSRLIDDLLAYSRLERRAMRTGKLNPQSLVEMVIAEHANELQERQVTLSVDIPCGTVTAEAEGLIEALRNLLENALKFSRDLPTPRIEIGGRETDKTCILWVRDNGIGFDMQYHDRIFEIFQRLHRAEDYPGTGIGLAIVRRVMQRIGGRVWGDSTPGRGATFYLEVPK